MLLIAGTGLLLILMGRKYFIQASMVANPQMVRATQTVQGDRSRPGYRK